MNPSGQWIKEVLKSDFETFSDIAVVRSQHLPVAALDVFPDLPGSKTLGQSPPRRRRRRRWSPGHGTFGLPCRGGPSAGGAAAGAGPFGVSGAGDVGGEDAGLPTAAVGRAVPPEVSTPPVAVDQPGRGATAMEASEGGDTSDCYGEARPCLAGSG